MIIAAIALVQHLQSVVSRNIAPADPCVRSVTRIEGRSAYNVIPDMASFSGTLRFFSDSVRELAQSCARVIYQGFTTAHGINIDAQFREIPDVLVNNGKAADSVVVAAAEIVGEDSVRDDERRRLRGFRRNVARGARGLWLVKPWRHDPAPEAILPVGASILARVAERQLGIGT